MAKIVFLDEQEAQKHEASPQDTAELFKLAEQLSDTELGKMARAIARISQENPQNIAKN